MFVTTLLIKGYFMVKCSLPPEGIKLCFFLIFHHHWPGLIMIIPRSQQTRLAFHSLIIWLLIWQARSFLVYLWTIASSCRNSSNLKWVSSADMNRAETRVCASCQSLFKPLSSFWWTYCSHKDDSKFPLSVTSNWKIKKIKKESKLKESEMVIKKPVFKYSVLQ